MAQIFLDFKVRVNITENKELYFIPEVLVMTSELSYNDKRIFNKMYGDNFYRDEIKKYNEFYGRYLEWKVINPKRGYTYLDSRGTSDNKPQGYKTLKKAKEVLNEYKTKAKNEGTF